MALPSASRKVHENLDRFEHLTHNYFLAMLLGAGLGTSDVSYTRWGHYLYPDGTWSLSNESVGFSESLFTGIMTAEAGIRIYDAMSLGIMVDHVFAPNRDVQGWTAVGIEPTSLNLGNTSVGFSLSACF